MDYSLEVACVIPLLLNNKTSSLVIGSFATFNDVHSEFLCLLRLALIFFWCIFSSHLGWGGGGREGVVKNFSVSCSSCHY